MKILVIKVLLLACLLITFQPIIFAAEIKSSKINKSNKIKHHYVEKVVNTLLSVELGLKIKTSNSCTPESTKGTWVCYVFETEQKTDYQTSDHGVEGTMDRLWSVEVDFIKGEYAIYKGYK